MSRILNQELPSEIVIFSSARDRVNVVNMYTDNTVTDEGSTNE